ncbi:hypothetical protein C0Q70_02611 [Pomacea canaliculata]|uniref:Uncharacterized protein n=1 Tax=Pomacea canaliculata TaxID=400727 RepID=A0A2T7PQF3_POMCA|nr:hypothetical protein C0Q70_02611 [Pomacea canaliculata]
MATDYSQTLRLPQRHHRSWQRSGTKDDLEMSATANNNSVPKSLGRCQGRKLLYRRQSTCVDVGVQDHVSERLHKKGKGPDI